MNSAEGLPSYSVVLVEYHSGHHLFDCLESLDKQTHPPEKIVVVLNGIDPQEKEKLSAMDVHLIDPHDNLGYSRAANLGISNTTSEIVLTLNPDTIVDPECGERACRYLSEHNDVGAVGPRIYDREGEIYPSARREPSLLDAIGHALLSPIFPKNRFTQRYKESDEYGDGVREADWLSGAAIYARREALDQIGGWDERYFMYCEDIDLGRSLRQAGWKNVYVPQAHLMHVQGVSTSRRPFKLLLIHHKSLFLFTKKKYPHNRAIQILAGIFIAFRLPVALIAQYIRIH